MRQKKNDLKKCHWLGDSSFSAQFMGKNVVCFSDIFHRKSSEKFKSFSPLLSSLLNFSPRTK
jgi:hypothetical protein